MKALVAFESAARHGSFAQAAEELAVTPSAVSHQIQLLETFLGLDLFTRRGGRVTLTEAGRRYCREIDSAFQTIAEATAALAPRLGGEMLTVVISPSLAVKWLQPRLPAFLSACPKARVRLSTLSSEASLRTAAFDIAIAYGRPERPDVASVPLLREYVKPLCSPALARELGLRAVSDLRRATLIHSANLTDWSRYLKLMGIERFSPANELWIDRSAMAISAAVDSLGVILESDVLTAAEQENGTLAAPFDASETEIAVVGHHLAIKRGARGHRFVRPFLEWLESVVPQRNRAWDGDLADAAAAAMDGVPAESGATLLQPPAPDAKPLMGAAGAC